MKPFKKISLAFIFLFLFLNYTKAASLYPSPKKFDAFTFTPYAGMSVWNMAIQIPFESNSYPYYAALEIGKEIKPLSFIILANHKAEFFSPYFQIFPSFIHLNAKYSILKALKRSNKYLDLFATAGISGNYTLFTEQNYVGIEQYNLKRESVYKPGANAGMGISGYLGSIGITAIFNYAIANAEFIAGNFEPVKFSTGFYDVAILFSYQFKQKNPKELLCPAYK